MVSSYPAINQPTYQPVHPSIYPSINLSIHPINKSTNQQSNQLTNQPTNQHTIYPSIKLLLIRSSLLLGRKMWCAFPNLALVIVYWLPCPVWP